MATVLENTYTVALRSGQDPDKAVNLTLTEDRVHVEMTGLEDRLQRIAAAENRATEATNELKSQWEIVSLKALEKLSGPFHVSDVSASMRDGCFHLYLWRRVGSLRLMPIWLNFEQVDNREAAEGFIRELEKRKQSSRSVQALPGPLDYWAGWVGIGLGVVLTIRLARR